MDQSPIATDADNDELRLAQLACVKFAGLVQGLISVGLPGAAMGDLQLKVFLQERFPTLNAFALVLHTVAWRPADSEHMDWLRSKSSEVLSNLKVLQHHLFAALEAPSNCQAGFLLARASAAALFDSLSEYAKLVRLDSPRIVRARTVVLETFDWLPTLEATAAPAAP